MTVPGNNSILSDEQDFTIGLQTTVLNVPELVKGTKLKYTAFVQTDFGKKTSTRSGYITVSKLVAFCKIHNYYFCTDYGT